MRRQEGASYAKGERDEETEANDMISIPQDHRSGMGQGDIPRSFSTQEAVHF